MVSESFFCHGIDTLDISSRLVTSALSGTGTRILKWPVNGYGFPTTDNSLFEDQKHHWSSHRF